MKTHTRQSIPFGNLRLQYRGLRAVIDTAVSRVLSSGRFILGQELAAFEALFAQRIGMRYAVGVGSGTDALVLALRASGVGAGDEVVTVPNSAVATATAIVLAGARPVFVDIDEHHYGMDPDRLEACLKVRTRKKPSIRAVIPVHLYGHPAPLQDITRVARRHGVTVIEDVAQAQGALCEGKPAGSFGLMSAFSFYPSKNLGAYGDAGMVATDSSSLYRKLIMLRNYGQADRYYQGIIGQNSRCDEIQAAILRAKLPYLEAWNTRRREIAVLYGRLIDGGACAKPYEAPWARHTYHLYVIRTAMRDSLMKFLWQRGIETFVHYPVSAHLQKSMRGLGYRRGDFPVAERCARQVLSLPIYPELKDAQVYRIAGEVNAFFHQGR